MGRRLVCDRCGIASESGIGYSRAGGRMLCGRCAARTRDAQGHREAWWVWGLFVAAGIAWWRAPDAQITRWLLLCCLIYGLAVCLTLVHESGHAIVGALIGMKVRGFRLGMGPVLLRLGSDRFRVELRMLPISGATFFETAQVVLRGRFFLSTLAGPATEAAVLIWAWGWSPPEGWPVLVRWDLIYLTIASLLVNLIPRRRLGNDGWRMLWLLRVPDQELDSLGRTDQRNEAAQRLASMAALDPDERAEARRVREELIEHLDDVGLTAEALAVTLNNIAAADLLIGDAKLLQEAEEYSGRAIHLIPFEPAILDTRGSVLVELGREEEAIPLLEAASASVAPEQRGSGHAYLALAYIRKGNLYDARKHFVLARQTGRVFRPLQDAEPLIAEAEVRNLYTHYLRDDVSEGVGAFKREAGTLAARDLAGRLAAWLTRAEPDRVAQIVGEARGTALAPEEALAGLRQVVEALELA